MLGLLVAGLVVGVAGLLSIVFAIPMKEFSFGNTLIVSGVIAACAGLILVAAALLLRELKTISQALTSQRPPAVPVAPGGHAPHAGEPPPRRQEPPHRQEEAPLAPPPWAADQALAEGPDEVAAEAGPPARKRRNLLFMSTRRERAAAGIDAAEDQLSADAGGSGATPPASFEDAWPAADRGRGESVPVRQPPVAARSAEAATGRAAPPPLRRPAETQQVTVLKSGVVDGMAYSLYSDGSIEAQLPEGMIRFSSIDELRHHLDQRGG